MPQFISVIIPVGNPKTFSKTIDAILNQSIEKNNYELIVVIPKELSSSKIKIPSIKIIETEKLYPPGKMRNIGARHAEGDPLFFIDDDCVPPSAWIASISEIFMENPDVGAVGCRLIGMRDTFWERCADYALFSRYQYNTTFQGPLGSAAIAVRKKVFDSVNGFEETLLASEDWDFSLKLEGNGWLCQFEPDIEVRHNHQRGSFWDILNMGFKSGFRSGLFVQEKFRKQMSMAALVLLKLKRPFLYPFAMLPYAIVLTLFLIWELRRTDPRVFLFGPFIFLSRLSYQIGVWTRLMYNSS